jgi:hypothetical protein
MPTRIIGREQALEPLKEELKRAANYDSSWYYLWGHGGTGKTLVLNELQTYVRHLPDTSEKKRPLCILIDFQLTEILFIEGLMDAIVSRIRQELGDANNHDFDKYDSALANLVQAQRDYLLPDSQQTLPSTVYQAFKADYERLVKNYRIMLLFDTMEQFDQTHVIEDNTGIRDFFRDYILTLHGTVFVLAGRSHRNDPVDDSPSQYTWYADTEAGLRPRLYARPNEALQPINPKYIHNIAFSEFDLDHIERFLLGFWHTIGPEKRHDFIYKKVLSHIHHDDDPRTETDLFKVLKNPLLLTLFAEHFLQNNYFNIENLPALQEDIEFILVQNYYELGGLSDVVMYVALKDYGFDEYDLASIMRIDLLSAKQKLKALRNRNFVKCNQNNTFTLHDEIRRLIETHLWQAYDELHEQRFAIYHILLARYREQLLGIQKALANRIKMLQAESGYPYYDILNHVLGTAEEVPLPEISILDNNDRDSWEYYPPSQEKALMNPKQSDDNRRITQIWIKRQCLERRKEIIVREMRRMVERLNFCKDIQHQVNVFELEWYLAKYSHPERLQTMTDDMIAKMIHCGFWELTDSHHESGKPDLRELNFRVAYRQGRNLEYQQRYEEADAFYQQWLGRVANYDDMEDKRRYIYLLTRQAMARLRNPDAPLSEAIHILEVAHKYCVNHPAIAQNRSNIEAKIAWIHHLQSHFVEAQEWYENSLKSLSLEKDGLRLRANLAHILVQLGYVQRYSNPRIGIELAQLGYNYLVREGHNSNSALALRSLAALHRRNGDYEDSFRYAFQSYKLARQIERHDIEAFALIELAVTRWHAVMDVRGTDAKRSYIIQPAMPLQTNANIDWMLQHLEEAYHLLNNSLDDHVMQLEFLRLNHLLLRANIEAGNESQSRHYLAEAKGLAAIVDDFFYIQQIYADELLLEYTFDQELAYGGFINLPAYTIVMEKIDHPLNVYFVGMAQHLAGQVAQRMAILSNNDELFDTAIEHYMQAYIYLAQQPNWGTFNLQQDWRLLEDRIRELEMSNLPQARTSSLILNWCDRITNTFRPYHPHWQKILKSFPQLKTLVDVIRIRQQLLTLQMKPISDQDDIYTQVDLWIERRQYAQAWRIIVKRLQEKAQKLEVDFRMILREVEVLTALERIATANHKFETLCEAITSEEVYLNEEEEHRFWVQQSVIWTYYAESKVEGSHLKKALLTILEVLSQLDKQNSLHLVALVNFRFGDILQHMGYYHPSRDYFTTAMQLYVQLENPIAAADCLLRLSRLHSLIGDYELGIWYADQGTAFMYNLKHDEGIIEGYTALGIAYRSWAVYASLRGAPGTLLQHYQHVRHYLDTANKQAQDRRCYRFIPEILKEISLTLRYESNIVAYNRIAYDGMLAESWRYLAEATRRYEAMPEHKRSPRQMAELYQLRGHVYRKLAAWQYKQNPEKHKALVDLAFEEFEQALKYGKQSNDYVIIAGTYLTLIEMLYVNSWADPEPTSNYAQLKLQFRHETDLYQHFRQNDSHFSELYTLREEFQAMPDDLFGQLHQTLAADDLLKIPDGLRHYFGRIEMIFANVAAWGGYPDAAIEHCANAGRYFARSSRAVYNVKHMLRQIRHFLDDTQAMPPDMAQKLLNFWADDPIIEEVYPDLLALCRAYRYIQEYVDASYDTKRLSLEVD